DDSLADVRAAVAFIRCHADDFGIDPNQLVLLGEDSGADLAARVAAERPPGVIGSVLIGGSYEPAAVPGEKRDMDRSAALIASPPRRATPLPLLVVHGEADTETRPDLARRFCAEASAAGGRCQFVGVAGASHRSEN